jgi:glycosyltransferase involved in cell wall biosynthesis
VVDYSYPIPAPERDGALSIILPALLGQKMYSRGPFGAWRDEVGGAITLQAAKPNQCFAVSDGEKLLQTTTDGRTPTVSVIIPSYNTAFLIATCLDSVFAQTYQDFEVIVVNDGSPDTPQLEEVLQPYRDKIVYMVQPNKRAAGARNTAIGKARGTFLAFLDSDDSWLPEHLESQIRMFEQESSLDMVYADGELISDAPRRKTFMETCPSEGSPSFEALVVERCQIPISTVVVRKAAIIKAGLFDESLPRCDDYDMWMRTAFFGARLGFQRRVQARLYLGRPDSLGQSDAKMNEAYWKILEKAAQTLPLSEAQAELVRERAEEIHARYLLEEGKMQLRERQPEKARHLFEQANQHLRRLRLTVAIRGLKLAPQSATALIAMWNRCRDRIMVR